MKRVGVFVLSLMMVLGSVAAVEADSNVTPGVDLEWSLYEWAVRESGQKLSWYEWALLQYTIPLACGSLSLGASAAFTPLAGYITNSVCSFGLAA